MHYPLTIRHNGYHFPLNEEAVCLLVQ